MSSGSRLQHEERMTNAGSAISFAVARRRPMSEPLPDPSFPPSGASRPRGLSRWALAACALLLFFGGLGAFPLLEPDEGRYAEIPREMLALRDFVTPRLNGVLYFEKPPLYYWLNAAALSALRPEVACRLASAF